MRKLLIKICDHISFFRPLLLIPIWTPALLGFWAGGGSESARGEGNLLLFATFLGAGIYGLNQIYDVKGDKLNSKNLPLSLGYISNFMAWFLAIFAFFSALFIAFFVSIPVLIAAIAAVALGIEYSAPPLRIKDKPYPALIANALGHGSVMYIIGALFAHYGMPEPKWDWFLLVRMIPYAIAYGAVYLFTTVPDAAGDKQVSKVTFAVIFGQRQTMLFALSGVFFAGAFGTIFSEPALFLTAIVSLPFYIAAIAHSTVEPRLVVRANKVAVLALAVFTFFYFPPFVVPVALAVTFAWLYNRKRLGVNYP